MNILQFGEPGPRTHMGDGVDPPRRAATEFCVECVHAFGSMCIGVRGGRVLVDAEAGALNRPGFHGYRKKCHSMPLLAPSS